MNLNVTLFLMNNFVFYYLKSLPPILEKPFFHQICVKKSKNFPPKPNLFL